MRNAIIILIAASLLITAGCSGISTVNYSRCDRGRPLARIAVVAHNISTADRYKMWAWTKKHPRIVPEDNFDEEIFTSLTNRTDYKIIPQAQVREVLQKLNLQEKIFLSRKEKLILREALGADAILFADVSFYLQNYLFWKTFGVVEITMRLYGTPDNRLLWEAKGRNFALFVTTDSALKKVRDKMLGQLAQKLEADKPLAKTM
ncbi:MAG: DUF799 family lipoprotein [Candidatus Aureabacteria bacterium]|nr:DUF799 family lipoprotein [Candidatus Auribacterota bacterium]